VTMPFYHRLEAFGLTHARLEAGVFGDLFGRGAPPGGRELDLSDNRLGRGGALRLGGHVHPVQPGGLRPDPPPLDPAALGTLNEAGLLDRVRELHLDGNPLGTEGARVLVRILDRVPMELVSLRGCRAGLLRWELCRRAGRVLLR